MKLTREEIFAARTPKGGWTKKQLSEWGVPWPPQTGWINNLITGTPSLSQPEEVMEKEDKEPWEPSPEQIEAAKVWCRQQLDQYGVPWPGYQKGIKL